MKKIVAVFGILVCGGLILVGLFILSGDIDIPEPFVSDVITDNLEVSSDITVFDGTTVNTRHETYIVREGLLVQKFCDHCMVIVSDQGRYAYVGATGDISAITYDTEKEARDHLLFFEQYCQSWEKVE
ncbi:MAG: hypothetical protein GY841_23485 [FCB group bacterium]|nr:hypothetical protein [FCB group bacterium]